jgi:hypothetical protein
VTMSYVVYVEINRYLVKKWSKLRTHDLVVFHVNCGTS